jgi:3-oxoacyl-[acyl-carrier-protein] synthase III
MNEYFPAITGTGFAVPANRLTNQDLQQYKNIVHTPDKIVNATGIEQRYWVADNAEHASDLGAEAGRQALRMADVEAAELEALRLATTTPDYQSPSVASLVHQKLAAAELCDAIDLNAACAGGVAALGSSIEHMMTWGSQRTLAIGSEILSYGARRSRSGTAILFGDGAGAAVLERDATAQRPYFAAMTVPDRQAIFSPGVAHNKQPEFVEKGQIGAILMTGKKVAEHAGRVMPTLAHKVAEQADILDGKGGIDWDGVDYMIPHQANLRMLEALRDGLGVPHEKFVTTVQQFGNTSGASVLMALAKAHAEGFVEPGPKRVLFTSIGAGMVGAAALVSINLPPATKA